MLPRISRRFLLRTFVIGLACLVMYGIFGSIAWFTSSATAQSTISSGNFDLEVTGGPLDLTRLEPGAGYRQVGEFCLVNNGDYDMKLRVRADNVNDPGGLQNLLNFMLILKPINSDDQNNYGGQADLVIFSDMPFTALLDWNDEARLLFDRQGVVEPFVPNMKSCYKLYASLSEEAGSYQLSQSLTFELLFNATQSINPGW